MFDSILTTTVTLQSFLLCMGVSIVLGLGTALLCMFRNRYTHSFVVTLALLPVIVQVVIMLVNGNFGAGAGVAVAGAFSLVRFRSVPGSAREIGLVFLSMAIGLATGMGYVALAALFFIVVALFYLLLTACRFGAGHENERELKITIPENLDYDGLFDGLFAQYTVSHELSRIKTSSMGTLYELDYCVALKSSQPPKEFLDALHCRNGNLNIVCGRIATKEEL